MVSYGKRLTIELCQKFCDIISPSGYEERMFHAIVNILDKFGYEIQTDVCGNLICNKKTSSIGQKKIAFIAHMDTASIVINGIDSLHNNVYWGSLSKWKFEKIENQSITFLSGSTAIAHISDKSENSNILKEVNGQVEIGDVATLTPHFEISDNIITGTFLDDRVGCAILVDVACKLKKTNLSDISFIFTTQEEIGNKGAYNIAQCFDFDEVYCIDTTRAFSQEYNKPIYPLMGGGACIKICDGSGFCSKKLNCEIKKIAEDNNISIQTEVLFSGGCDILPFTRHRKKTEYTGISIPCKNMHSRSEQVCISDILAVEDLIIKILLKEKCEIINL